MSTADTYISLGDTLRYLVVTEGYPVASVSGQIRTALRLLSTLGFSVPEMYVRELELIHRELDLKEGNEATKQDSEKLRTLVRHVMASVQNEAKRRSIAVLDTSAVSNKLREIEAKLKEPHQQIIVQDTIKCLESGAYRAAIVMGWNLAFEHLRQWIHADETAGGRLDRFNALLTQRNRDKTNKYDPIVDYDDFVGIGEALVIEIAHLAKLLPKAKWQLLEAGLNRRNHFAHPNFEKATVDSAKGYIDDLIINVVEDPNFTY